MASAISFIHSFNVLDVTPLNLNLEVICGSISQKPAAAFYFLAFKLTPILPNFISPVRVILGEP